MTSDDRFTWGLILDVLEVLERHGYRRYDSQHTGEAVAKILDLAYVYDGTRAVSNGTYLRPALPDLHAEPGPSGSDASAVVLVGAEASSVISALGIAADYKRDRAAACTDCADQSCLTCQSRLRDAQAYDRTAAQMLRTGEASRPPTPVSPRRTARRLFPASSTLRPTRRRASETPIQETSRTQNPGADRQNLHPGPATKRRGRPRAEGTL
jgi:hypothetical protein